MSILIAYKRGDTVYMGTDTMTIVGDNKRNELCESNYKIQRLDNGILVGITGERLERQTISANAEIFTLDKKGALTKSHIVKEIVPRLIEELRQANLLVQQEDTLPYMKATILLAYKDTLLEICSGFSVVRYEDFQAVGKVADYAHATMANIQLEEDVNDKIIKALSIAAKHSQYVGSPYLLIDTKNLQYRLIKEAKQW